MLPPFKRISYKQNVLSFKSLSSTLASKDVLLILRLECSSGCQQYWAIIPPESGIDQFSHATTLTYGGGRSVGAGANEILRGLETNDASHMVNII